MAQRYDCEIIGVIVLMLLSAVSHFWYIMIALCGVAGIVAAGLLISTLLHRANREVLDRFVKSDRHKPISLGSTVRVRSAGRANS